MSFDLFRDPSEPDSGRFMGVEWQDGDLKARLQTPHGDLYLDRSELIGQPFRYLPEYHKAALLAMEAIMVPVFEETFMQAKYLLHASVLQKDLFRFKFVDCQRKIKPDGKQFLITRQEIADIYSHCTDKVHITRQRPSHISGGARQVLRKNLVTLGFLCCPDKLANAIFWQGRDGDKIIQPGAERITASRSELSTIFNMNTDQARAYVHGRFRPPRFRPPELT